MSETSPRPAKTGLGSILLAVAIALAGWFIGNGVREIRTADRFVTVKGVSEREAKADLALWPILLAVPDADLTAAQSRINQNIAKVTAFLRTNGIDSTEIELQGLRVTDTFANPYNPPGRQGPRFVVQQTVMVRSEKPQVVLAASQKVGDLVNAGVVLSSGPEWGPGGPSYVFRRLNDLKPSMIAEATAEARKAAEQFAKDSKSKLGGIHRANQGVFIILPRDAAGNDGGQGMNEQSQITKTIRVVSTVEYLLRD
ncbi:MAG TPA: SIMPL domain-containing protein [Candidatus Eisenbacteria bacterium]|nr:SIMPL domain-containing protein [Candidatus Eisenbacteria bacterium]